MAAFFISLYTSDIMYNLAACNLLRLSHDSEIINLIKDEYSELTHVLVDLCCGNASRHHGKHLAVDLCNLYKNITIKKLNTVAYLLFS